MVRVKTKEEMIRDGIIYSWFDNNPRYAKLYGEFYDYYTIHDDIISVGDVCIYLNQVVVK